VLNEELCHRTRRPVLQGDDPGRTGTADEFERLIAETLRNHPGLTREEAAEWLLAFDGVRDPQAPPDTTARCLHFAFLIIGVSVMLATSALAQATPVPRVGSCPSGYTESGGYCAPMSGTTRPAIVKSGQCPANWISSGAYCLGPPARR
jgi:hypothetical protein